MNSKKKKPAKMVAKKQDLAPVVKLLPQGRTMLSDLEDGEPIRVALSEIDLFSNYRKYYDPTAIAEFGASIKELGYLIHPVTLRRAENGRYQLVVGFRRYFGAKWAELAEIDGVVRKLTDEQVEDIQLQENIQREDPHPMHEAEQVGRMYSRKLTTEDIAARLGKSVTWVYRRSKLCGLTPGLQEMFLAGVFNLIQAYEIADLSPEAQRGFFDRYCAGWKESRPGFANLSHILSSFRSDLSEALFDPSRQHAGSKGRRTAQVARFNTAFKGLLIPDLEGEAKCTRVSCFDDKYIAHVIRSITKSLAEDQPVAFITYGELSDQLQRVLDSIPAAAALPIYQVETVSVIEEPEKPSIEEFRIEDYPDDDDFSDDGPGNQEGGLSDAKADAPLIDKEGYDEAISYYNEELLEYQAEIASDKALKGYYLSSDKLGIVYYYPVAAGRRLEPAKAQKPHKIMDLIKAQQDTPEDLLEAIRQIEIQGSP